MIEVTYRKIAIVLVKRLPIQDHMRFSDKVGEYVKTMERLPVQAQLALKAAYIFSAKSRHGIGNDEQQDCFQDYFTAVLEKSTDSEALAYTIAKRRWIDKFKQHRRRNSIAPRAPSTTSDQPTLDSDFIARLESAVDADSLWEVLPAKIKIVVQKRLDQQALTSTERARLSRYLGEHGQQIRELATA